MRGEREFMIHVYMDQRAIIIIIIIFYAMALSDISYQHAPDAVYFYFNPFNLAPRSAKTCI